VFIAAGVALAVSILLTPYLIRFFGRQGFGQEIRAEGPQSHQAKRGTPTMGGVAILLAIWLGYLASHVFTGLPITASALLVLFLTTALGVVGFLDDFIKLRRQRNLGLNKTSKLVGQLVTALVFAILAIRLTNSDGLSPASVNLSFVRDITVLSFGVVGFVVFAYFVIAAWSNAVNLTDGLDGLAAGTAAMVLATYVIIAFWQFRNACADRRRARLLPGARPARRRDRRRRRDGRLHRVPVVERRARAHLHGRHRLARPRRAHRRAVDRDAHRAAARRHRRGVRGGGAVGGAADRGVPHHRAAAVPHGALPPPLRAGRLGRDHRDHPVLAARGHVRGAGPGAVLQRVAERERGAVTGGRRRPAELRGPARGGGRGRRVPAGRGAALLDLGALVTVNRRPARGPGRLPDGATPGAEDDPLPDGTALVVTGPGAAPTTR
jgi:hypothetical protein